MEMILLAFLLFVGGLGKDVVLMSVLGLMGMLLLLIWKLIIDKKIIFPQWLGIYGIFLILFAVSNWWSMDMEISLGEWFLFTSAGVWGLVGYNLGKWNKKRNLDVEFLRLMIGLGLVFGLVNILSRIGVLEQFMRTPRGLVGWYVFKEHAHIGDFWALVLVGVFLSWMKKNQWWQYVLFIIGGYFVFLSRSRSALLALVIGVGYLIYKKKIDIRKYAWIFGVVAMVFVIFGATKQTLINRQYWLQGLVGVVRKPLGVGMGNFRELSGNVKNHVFGLSGYSSNAHNLLLEIVGGMGVFGLYFVWWFIKVIKDLVKKDNGKHIGVMAIFLALTINFMTDSTYLVPTMLWLWFMFLGYLTAKFKLK